MIAPGNSFIQIALALAFVIASGYASGRIHQWYKHGLERDDAYREGYNQASRSMFDMVMRAGNRPSRYETVNLDSSASPSSVGMSRQRIMVHPARPSAGKRRRHAA